MCSNIKISPKGFYKRNIVIMDTRDVPGGPVVKSTPEKKKKKSLLAVQGIWV